MVPRRSQRSTAPTDREARREAREFFLSFYQLRPQPASPGRGAVLCDARNDNGAHDQRAPQDGIRRYRRLFPRESGVPCIHEQGAGTSPSSSPATRPTFSPSGGRFIWHYTSSASVQSRCWSRSKAIGTNSVCGQRWPLQLGPPPRCPGLQKAPQDRVQLVIGLIPGDGVQPVSAGVSSRLPAPSFMVRAFSVIELLWSSDRLGPRDRNRLHSGALSAHSA